MRRQRSMMPSKPAPLYWLVIGATSLTSGPSFQLTVIDAPPAYRLLRTENLTEGNSLFSRARTIPAVSATSTYLARSVMSFSSSFSAGSSGQKKEPRSAAGPLFVGVPGRGLGVISGPVSRVGFFRRSVGSWPAVAGLDARQFPWVAFPVEGAVRPELRLRPAQGSQVVCPRQFVLSEALV